jgi:hypothetical protein
MPKTKGPIQCSNIELSGGNDTLREAESFIASQWLKSVMNYKDRTRLGYVITVGTDAEEDSLAVFPSPETNEKERFTSNRQLIEERLRLWLAEG